MKNGFISLLIPALIATAGAWIGIPNPVFHFPPAVILYPLGIAWLGMEAASGRAALKRGWATGILATLGCMYWIALPPYQYGGLPLILSAPLPVLMCMALAIYPALFAIMARYAVRGLSPLWATVFLGLGWAALEQAQDFLFSGFPWLELAAGLASWPWTIQLAAVVGGHMVSGLAAMTGAGLLLCFHNAGGRSRAPGLLAVITAVIITGYGFLSMEIPISGDTNSATRAAAIQGNIDQSRKWDDEYRISTIQKYVDLTRNETTLHNATLSIWPETALPFYLQDPTLHGAEVKLLAKHTGTWILTGAPAYTMHAPSRTYKLYNRAFLIGPDGQIAGWYDKEHLVPFGEYVPFEPVFGKLGLGKLVEAAGDFLPGNNTDSLKVGNLALGMLICYEGIFTELAQKRVENGANLLVTISNDAWYGRSSAPLQHLNLTIVRAVEQNRYLIRSTNTGISAFVDPKGRITARTDLFTTCGLSADVRPVFEKTIYHQGYTYIRVGTWVLVFLMGAIAVLRGRKSGDTLNSTRQW